MFSPRKQKSPPAPLARLISTQVMNLESSFNPGIGIGRREKNHPSQLTPNQPIRNKARCQDLLSGNREKISPGLVIKSRNPGPSIPSPLRVSLGDSRNSYCTRPGPFAIGKKGETDFFWRMSKVQFCLEDCWNFDDFPLPIHEGMESGARYQLVAV
jgi:hypothetical protein